MKSWVGMAGNMVTSSNENIFRGAGSVCGEFTGHRWIPLTKASNAELCFFICVWTNDWLNNRDAGDLRRDRAHYDVTVKIQRNETNELNHTNFAISHNIRPKRLCFPQKNLQHRFYTSESRNHRNTTIFTRDKAFGSLWKHFAMALILFYFQFVILVCDFIIMACPWVIDLSENPLKW